MRMNNLSEFYTRLTLNDWSNHVLYSWFITFTDLVFTERFYHQKL